VREANVSIRNRDTVLGCRMYVHPQMHTCESNVDECTRPPQLHNGCRRVRRRCTAAEAEQ